MDTHVGEHMIFEGHPSWRSILSFYFKGLVGVALAGALAAGITRIAQDHVKGGTVAVVVIAVGAIVLLLGFVRRISTTYAITNQRLRIRRGIVARHVQETRLARVQNVNTNQSVLERVLQVGSVDFDTAGSGDSDFAFRGVAQPEHVMQKVEQAQREFAEEARTTGLGDPQA